MRQMFTPPDYTKGKNFCLSLIISTIFSTKTFEKTIVLYNEQFYWTNDFSERLFCENMNDNFENKRFQLFDWKKTNEFGRVWTIRDVNVFIFQKNDRFVMITTTKNRKRNDRF